MTDTNHAPCPGGSPRCDPTTANWSRIRYVRLDAALETLSGVPIIINCRDRLGSLVELVDYLERAGQDRIYLLDNDSAYPPLLEYLAHSPHEVVRLGRNAGRLSPGNLTSSTNSA